MSEKQKSIYDILLHWRDFRLKLFFEGIVIGLLAGTVVVLFRFLLEHAELLRGKIYTVLRASSPGTTVLWFLALILISYLLVIIVQREPMTSGSGIPQVKGVLLGHFKMKWLRVMVGKFIGGVLAIGAGLSLGREGPSVQLGATVGQGVSRILGRLRVEEKYLITSGASAGLAAAFNAPLAGAIFALEELHKNFSPVVLTSAMAASLTADFVAQEFFGQKPIFNFHDLPVLPTNYYLYLIGLGLVAGVCGALFNRSLVVSLSIYSKLKLIPDKLKPAIPLVIGGILGFILPEVLGGGNKLIDTIGQGYHYSLLMLGILFVTKFFFTLASYGAGVPGGIFLPMLVIGALAGNIYGHIVVQYMGLNAHYINNFVVFAMTAFFTAVVKAPVTGIILIMEMTGSFSHMFALMTVSMSAYVVGDILKVKPIYDVLLERSLSNNNFEAEEKKVMMEFVVCLGSEVAGKRLMDINWPPHCLIVGIRRSDTDIIPKGSTRIYTGDYLTVLANGDQAGHVRSVLQSMTSED